MPRRRTILTIAACLLGGAVINVLVAWGCTWRSIAYSRATWRKGSPAGPLDWPVAVPTGWPSTSWMGVRNTTLGTMQDSHSASEPEPAHRTGTWSGRTALFYAKDYQYGWPLHSLNCGRIWEMEYPLYVVKHITPSTLSERLYRGLHLPRWMNPRNIPVLNTPTLPLLPIATGFTANTLIYASVLWLAFGAPRVVRTARRRRRGQCLACGYDLAALPQCPECGRSKSESRGTIVPRLPPR